MLYFVDSEGTGFGYTGYKIEIIYKGETTVEETEYTHRLQVYPNPGMDVLYVKSENMHGNISIYNSSGEAINCSGNITLSNDQFKIDVSSLTSGVYILMYQTVAGTQTSAFVISK
jgi:hypothetical protein